MAVTGKRYEKGELSIFASLSAAWRMHSSAASRSIQCNVYNSLVSALPRLKLDSFLLKVNYIVSLFYDSMETWMIRLLNESMETWWYSLSMIV